MKRLLVLVALAACGTHHREAPVTSPPWRVELPGALPQALTALPDGGAAVALVIDRAVTVAGQTFAPTGSGDVVVVALGADGQPRSAFALGLAAPTRIGVIELVPEGAGLTLRIATDARFTVAGHAVTADPAAAISIDLARGPTGATAASSDRTLPRIPDELAAASRQLLPGAKPQRVARAERAGGVVELIDVDAHSGGNVPDGTYAIWLDEGGAGHRERLDIDPPIHTGRAAVLADGALLLAGACDDAGTIGCLVRANPSWK